MSAGKTPYLREAWLPSLPWIFRVHGLRTYARTIYSATILRPRKMTTVTTAVAGTVISHELMMARMMVRFRAAMPRAMPTPMTEPTRVWLVETGNPSLEHTRTVVAVANSAEKPREGVMEVIYLPIVSMTL